MHVCKADPKSDQIQIRILSTNGLAGRCEVTMDNKGSFGFSLPDLLKGNLVTPEKAEVFFQSCMFQKLLEFHDAVWQLVRFYSSCKEYETAAKYIHFLMSLTDDPEAQAAYLLELGKMMEQIQNFQEAVNYYKQAVSMEPTESYICYFMNNNLGYSLIQLGEFEQAEPYCRAAIEIAPWRHNAYKNLGLSLQGQARYREAAESYILAIRAYPADPRALNHLEALVQQHPQVRSQVPEIPDLLDKSRDAVEQATHVTDAAITYQQAGSQDLTHVEKILVAVSRIIFAEGRTEFSGDEICQVLGLTKEEWMSAYTSIIFQAMHEDQPGSALPIQKEYRGVFRQVKYDIHSLTPHGFQVVQNIYKIHKN